MSNWARKRLHRLEEIGQKRKRLRLHSVDEASLHELISAYPRLHVKEEPSTSSSTTFLLKEPIEKANFKKISQRNPTENKRKTSERKDSSITLAFDDDELDDLQTEILFGGDYEAPPTVEEMAHIEFSNLILQDSNTGQAQANTGVFVRGLGALPSEVVSTTPTSSLPSTPTRHLNRVLVPGAIRSNSA